MYGSENTNHQTNTNLSSECQLLSDKQTLTKKEWDTAKRNVLPSLIKTLNGVENALYTQYPPNAVADLLRGYEEYNPERLKWVRYLYSQHDPIHLYNREDSTNALNNAQKAIDTLNINSAKNDLNTLDNLNNTKKALNDLNDNLDSLYRMNKGLYVEFTPYFVPSALDVLIDLNNATVDLNNKKDDLDTLDQKAEDYQIAVNKFNRQCKI